MSGIVLLGAKTRLGRAVLARTDQPVLLVARDAADAAVLAGSASPSGTDVSTSEHLAARTAVLGSGELLVVIAALGPVQAADTSDEAAFAAHSAGVARDLALLDRVLEGAAAADRPVRVVLVSSVLALAPAADRRYYGGWKCLVEHRVEQHVAAARAAVALTVLHPGRLHERARRPWHRVHTSYDALARVVLAEPSDRGVASTRRRLVGLDARIWLNVRSISFATRSLGP